MQPDRIADEGGADARYQDADGHNGEHRQPGAVRPSGGELSYHIPGPAQVLDQLLLGAGRSAHNIPVIGNDVLRLLPGEHPPGPALQPDYIAFFHGTPLPSLLCFSLLIFYLLSKV